MARYIVTVRTPRSPEAAFGYMADLRNLAEWDPGVRRVAQIAGDGGGATASFDVVVASGRGELTLRYITTQYEEPRLVVIAARSRMLTSIDRVTINADAVSGCLVTYDAELKLNGLLRLADLALRPVFKRIGDRAARGLVVALAGVVVAP
jgi:Polyketide cyclase / dehydrase and lipid transport